VLFQHPDIFNRYKISSPSLWWDNGVTFEFEKKYSEKHSDLPARVFYQWVMLKVRLNREKN